MNQPAKTPGDRNTHSISTALAFLLMFFYSLPLFLGLASLMSSHGMQESSWAVTWFAAFLRTSDSTLSEFHKVLIPAISAIAIVAYANRPTSGMYALAAFVFVCFVVALFTSVWFDVKSVQEGLEGLDGGLTAEAAKDFLAKIRETLLTFFMMLVGLKLVNAEPSAKLPGKAT